MAKGGSEWLTLRCDLSTPKVVVNGWAEGETMSVFGCNRGVTRGLQVTRIVIHLMCKHHINFRLNNELPLRKLVPERGFEPPTNCLRSSCSTN